jgi:hypothetical protein
MDSFFTEAENLKREILDLKTAQRKPSLLNLYHAAGEIKEGYYLEGLWTWTITYEDDGTDYPPITTINSFLPFGAYLKPATGNTQKIYYYSGENENYFNAGTIRVSSSRKIISITQDQTPITQEWTQVRAFYPSAMGTTPGWCLQNSRQGFLIPYGTFQTARADMESQQANGTLHSGTPPDYIAVPVYYANYNITTAGHVAVWDHGTVWSDGVQFPSIDSVTNSYVGWGELCDGARVVQHI